jgi:hypothetical protein
MSANLVTLLSLNVQLVLPLQSAPSVLLDSRLFLVPVSVLPSLVQSLTVRLVEQIIQSAQSAIQGMLSILLLPVILVPILSLTALNVRPLVSVLSAPVILC